MLEYFKMVKLGVLNKKLIDKYSKRLNALEAQRIALEAQIETLEGYNQHKIGELNNLSDINKSLVINLIAKNEKTSLFTKFRDRIFKFSGYIAYIDKAENLQIMRVNNFKDFYELNDSEKYGLNKKIGTYKGKPIFMLKYPIPISLDITGDKLQYDAISFYNFHNKLTRQNLTNWGQSGGLGEWLRKNFIIVLIGIALILLFFTPQGKEILSNIIPSSKPV
jgi:hypothetical protein